MAKKKDIWARFKKSIQYFRKRYFGLRLIILLLLLFLVAPFPEIIPRLVGFTIDFIFVGGVRTVSLARGYRQLEISKLERRILQDFDQDKSGRLDDYEQNNFQQATGFSLFKTGSSPRIEANDREIVELAKKSGYKTESYKQISFDCLRRAKKEEKELYEECMFYLGEGSFKAQLKPKRYLKWRTWKHGLLAYRRTTHYFIFSASRMKFRNIIQSRGLGKWYKWDAEKLNLLGKCIRDVGRGIIMIHKMEQNERWYKWDTEKFNQFKEYLRDIKRGTIFLHKKQGEPGYKID